MAIRQALLGADIATFTKDEENYDMVVRFKQNSRYDLVALLDQKSMFRNNKGQLLNIPIRSVIEEPEENISYTGVVREDQTSKVIISSDVTEVIMEMKWLKRLKKKC